MTLAFAETWHIWNLGIFRTIHICIPMHIKKSLSTISLYTRLTEPESHCIRTTWFHGSTPGQLGIFADNILVHYTHTTWLSLHSHSLISGSYICTTWNFYLCDKNDVSYVHLHNRIFITLVKHDFSGLWSLLCVYVFLRMQISYLYLCLN